MEPKDLSSPEAAGVEAGRLFDGGLYCAESVLETLARRQGVQSDLLPAIATGFCSGVAQTGGMCGAVSGAVMGLGLAFGRKDTAAKAERSYSSVRALVEDFQKEFGSTNCADLLGCHLGTVEGRRAFGERGLAPQCRAYTRRATELAAALIDRPSTDTKVG